MHSLFDTILKLTGEPSWVGALAWAAYVALLVFLLWLTVRVVRRTREATGAQPGSSERPGPPSPSVDAT